MNAYRRIVFIPELGSFCGFPRSFVATFALLLKLLKLILGRRAHSSHQTTLSCSPYLNTRFVREPEMLKVGHLHKSATYPYVHTLRLHIVELANILGRSVRSTLPENALNSGSYIVSIDK